MLQSVVLLGCLYTPGLGRWVSICTLTLVWPSAYISSAEDQGHHGSSFVILTPNHQSEDSTKWSSQAWCWWPVLALFPVPFTQAFVLSTSTFLSHTLSLLQSLRKKLTILQETLSLPPVTKETVSRLVFERFVTFCDDSGITI